MPINILMPALSPTMETGNLVKWHVKEGDTISSGELLADIETDKATMELESVEDGQITKIIVPEGTKDIAVNATIAEITVEDNEIVSIPKITEPIEIETTKNNLSKPKQIPTPKSNDLGSNKSNTKTRIIISPVAKKIASYNDININNIIGSGPHGRIIKKDIMSLINSKNELHESSFVTEKTGNAEIKSFIASNKKNSESILNIFSDRQYELIPTNGMRKIVAERLSEAKRLIPHFYLRRSIQIDKLLNLRAELNDTFENKKMKLSINDFIIKASAKSLQDNPKCNAIWANENIVQLKSSDVSVAVAIDDGLITPVIRDAEKKSLQEISSEMKEKARKAKEKKLLPEQYTGGSFSISNLGMMGVENFDAVINPPQASILAVGSAIKKPIINSSGEISVGQVMSVTLSADHRVIDGAVGALFINSIVEYLSKPLKLLI